jgi:hypothetical protein
MSPAGLVSRGIATVRIAGSTITTPIAKSHLVRKELRQLVPIHFAVAFSGSALTK